MKNKVNKEDAKNFLKETGYEFDSYIMTVVEIMLLDFAEQQVKIHCDKSNVIESFFRGAGYECPHVTVENKCTFKHGCKEKRTK